MDALPRDLTPQLAELAERLVSLDQAHLFENFGPPGVDDDKKVALLLQLQKLDAGYPLADYVRNARRLLADARAQVNPYKGFSPVPPQSELVYMASGVFDEMEELGVDQLGAGVCFVVVAGGLGERLGFSGIKLALPSETTTHTCFLELFCKSILALQERGRRASGVSSLTYPLAIMTSDDTHKATLQLLAAHENFGMEAGQISLLKQEKVPALLDNDARIALTESKDAVLTKPHGHGDIHALLHRSGLARKWLQEEGHRWVIFLQDTNGLVFRALPALLGVSAKRGFAMNSLCVPRLPGEPVGGICRLEPAPAGKGDRASRRAVCVNVEYSVLDSVLRSSAAFAAGDVASADTGFSPFPGNINVLALDLEPYVARLGSTGGAVPEFVNPKYANEDRSAFKSPARLESMMQDVAHFFPADTVGCTTMERALCFSPVKNNVADARKKPEGMAEAACTAESDMYALGRSLLALAGVSVATMDLPVVRFQGLSFVNGARIVLLPSFGTTLAEVRFRFPTPAHVSISPRSTLVLEGDVTINKLSLDGDLRIRAAPGARVEVSSLTVSNSGSHLEGVDAGAALPEAQLLRGFRIREEEALYIEAREPGLVVIDRP